MINSPVLITVYDRYSHFENCVNSLKQCEGAIDTTVYVALDFPANEKGLVVYNKIIQFVNNLSGFKEVILMNRHENFGAEKNVYTAIEDVFKNHHTLILSEDDNVFSKNFLKYINNGLVKFENDNSIFSISGYGYPIFNDNQYESTNYYSWTGFSAWGVGLWKNKYEKVDISTNYVRNFLKKNSNIVKLYSVADHYFPGAVEMIRNCNKAGDTLFSIYQTEHNMKSIFPVVSKVRNYGHDGSGVHNSHSNFDLYSNQLIDENNDFEFESYNDDVSSTSINLLLKNHFKRSLKSKMYHFSRLQFLTFFNLKK